MKIERLISNLFDLIEIPSPSLKEGEIADYVSRRLVKAGLEVIRDEANGLIGGESGNIIAKLKGEGPPILFCAHLDTIISKGKAKFIRDGDSIYGNGKGILGIDDKAGIAILLEVVDTIQEDPDFRHPDLEFVFTPAEEMGMLGAKAMNYEKIASKVGFVLDGDEKVGSIINHVPKRVEFKVEVKGRAAHAGSEPEKGVSAIVVASKAISKLKMGRIDEETTLNIGRILGGEVVNIVPETAWVEGEVRSRDPEKASLHLNGVKRAFEEAARMEGAQVRMSSEESFDSVKIDEGERVVVLAIKGAKACGVTSRILASGIGSDMNILNQHGIRSVILGVGIEGAHTPRERISIKDLQEATRWMLSIVRSAYEEEL
jgi:tripeptide aminopeptidase